MAKTRLTTKVSKADWKGYHKINLTNEQVSDFEENYAKAAIDPEHLGILVNNGYKFSLDWDDYNSGISASLYAKNKKMEWAGFTLSAWAGDPATAINLLLYKHYVVAKEQWEIVKPEREGSSVKFG